jgi:hypothetical protein
MPNQKDWSIPQLKAQFSVDVLACHTETERLCLRAVTNKGIRARADEIAATRKLTQGEISIARAAGWRGLTP